MVNPWQVDSIEAFNCLMCPECIFITKEKNMFEKHAVDNHPLSHVLFEVSNKNLTDFVEEIDQNSKSLQDKIKLNPKSNVEAHLDEDPNEISSENIENVKESNDAQGHEGINFNPCFMKYENSEEISNEIIETAKEWEDVQVHEGIKFNPFDIKDEDSEEISNEIIENSAKKSKGTLLCPICGKHFFNQQGKTIHIQTIHEGKKPFKCDTCGVNFSQKGHLNEHILRIHEKIKRRKSHKRELYSCVKCDYECDSNSKLSKHKWTFHKGRKLFSCSLCDAAYITQQNLVNHTRTIHEGKRFSCHICVSTFTQKHSLKAHIEYTHERKEDSEDAVFKCNNCISEFGSQYKLNIHFRKVHEETKCNICDIFLVKAELKLHVITEHKGKKFKCTICSGTFISQSSLLTHTSSVHEEKKFKCHICDKTFTVRGSLNYHMQFVCKGKKRTEK